MIQSTATIPTTLRTARAAFEIWMMGRAAAGDGFHFAPAGSGFTWAAASQEGHPASRGRLLLTQTRHGVKVTLTTDSYSLPALIREGFGKTRREVEDRVRSSQNGVLQWFSEYLSSHQDLQQGLRAPVPDDDAGLS